MQMSFLRKTLHFLESEDMKKILNLQVFPSHHFLVLCHSFIMSVLPPHFSYPSLFLNIVNQQNTNHPSNC